MQPEILMVDDTLRLRRFDGPNETAFSWYQDTETVLMVDGVKEPYTMEKLKRMYAYLQQKGELYWIEVPDGGAWRMIGDVCWWPEDLPMVIGDRRARGKGIGRRVLAALAQRAKALGFSEMHVREIYHDNEASRRCYEAAGFCVCGETNMGVSMKKLLT